MEALLNVREKNPRAQPNSVNRGFLGSRLKSLIHVVRLVTKQAAELRQSLARVYRCSTWGWG